MPIVGDILQILQSEPTGGFPTCFLCRKEIQDEVIDSVCIKSVFFIFHRDCWQEVLLNHYAERMKDQNYGRMIQ